jgi:hypothetical protein
MLSGKKEGKEKKKKDHRPRLLLTLVAHMPVHDGEADKLLEPLQLAHDERPACPRTRIADVEVVAALLGREPCAGLGRDLVPERAGLALELAARVAGLDPVGDLAALEASSVSEWISASAAGLDKACDSTRDIMSVAAFLAAKLGYVVLTILICVLGYLVIVVLFPVSVSGRNEGIAFTEDVKALTRVALRTGPVHNAMGFRIRL